MTHPALALFLVLGCNSAEPMSCAYLEEGGEHLTDEQWEVLRGACLLNGE